MYIGSCKEIFCNRTINLVADFVIYAHLRSCNHPEHKCHNNFLVYLLHNGASNSNISVDNTLQILKFHMFFNNVNSLHAIPLLGSTQACIRPALGKHCFSPKKLILF